MFLKEPLRVWTYRVINNNENPFMMYIYKQNGTPQNFPMYFPNFCHTFLHFSEDLITDNKKYKFIKSVQ